MGLNTVPLRAISSAFLESDEEEEEEEEEAEVGRRECSR
jgi:hypothetical protein